MIKDRTALAMYEVKDLLGEIKETDKTKELKEFIKKFETIDGKKAKKLKEEIESLGIIKIKNSDIIKIIDILPENAVELNKVLTEAGLDADETNKVLGAIKNNK
jgi:DNA-directed RNA polymerase subunit F